VPITAVPSGACHRGRVRRRTRAKAVERNQLSVEKVRNPKRVRHPGWAKSKMRMVENLLPQVWIASTNFWWALALLALLLSNVD